VTIDGRTVEGAGFADANIHIRVFNSEFVKSNVFAVKEGNLAPIFILGEASIVQQSKLVETKNEIDSLRSRREEAVRAKARAETSLHNFWSEQAKTIKLMLTAAGSAYNNYSRPNFQAALARLDGVADPAQECVSDKERADLIARHRAIPKPVVQILDSAPLELNDLAVRVKEACGRSVVAAGLDGLAADDHELTEWLRAGTHLHAEAESASCLYCGQPMPADRASALESHFSNELDGLLRVLDTLASDLESASGVVAAIQLPRTAEVLDEFSERFSSAMGGLEDAISKANEILKQLSLTVSLKRMNPFEPVEVDSPNLCGLSDAVKIVNEVLAENNSAAESLDSRTVAARERLERAQVAEVAEDARRLASAVTDVTGQIAKYDADLKSLEAEVQTLERSLIDHRKPARELNEELAGYLGHDELALEFADPGYRITRRGELALGLSEGEQTAIALLYFLKSLEDREGLPQVWLTLEV
jgi:wobble nucleotide-excising tRNase